MLMSADTENRHQLSSLPHSANKLLLLLDWYGMADDQMYDAFGRRIQNKNGTTFMYDGADAVQELSNFNVTANSLFASTDEVLARTDSSGVFTPLRDTLGSTVALADASGSIATTYTYGPFGNTTESGQPSTNAFQYTGRENDSNGLYYYRARYYSTNLNRFISEDPAAFDGGGNFYVYGADNPISFVDPFGMKPCPKLISAQDAAMNNPDFRASEKTTHCSETTESIVNAVVAPPLTGDANHIATELHDSSDYISVLQGQAQGLANSGDLVIAVWPNPYGHGHVATVRPLGVQGDHPIVHPNYPGRGPLLNNIGSSGETGINNENGSFALSQGKPSYYTPSMSGRQPCP
jgi:RHS repeat-associated protein